MKQYLQYIVVAALLVMVGCQRDTSEMGADYGYVQFKVVKASYFDTATRLTDELEQMADAHKLTVVLQHDGSTITQTLQLHAYDTASAEWGLQSDKLRLLTGDYSIIGFYLYDNLDEQLLTGDSRGDFTVVKGGLVVKPIEVAAVERGYVSFKLEKEFTRADDDMLFRSIKAVDLSVRNLFTHEETTFKQLPVSYQEYFTEGAVDDNLYDRNALSSFAVCDSIISIEAGNYLITAYTAYSDSKGRTPLGSGSIASLKREFSVEDNLTTADVSVPITLSTTAEHIRDYEALKAIWLALDGPNWTYHGEAYTPGANWDFNKDIDMWGDQPGVTLDGNGRVVSLNISGFGARGIVPDAIGQLTELRILYLGDHNEMLGGFEYGGGFMPDMASATDGRIDALDYWHKCLKRDGREDLSEELKRVINRDPEQRPILQSRIDLKDMAFGELTNDIQGISRAMMRLTKLEQFFLANSPITADGFFRDVEPQSPLYEEQQSWSWSNLTMLTDVEIYNCPKLTRLPLEMLTQLPNMQSLNLSVNKNISGAQLKADWEAIIDSPSGATLQILYLGFNNLEETPSYDYLKRMTKLGLLDCTNNALKVVHPFGKEISPSKLYYDFNRIERISAAEDGYFCGVSQLEEFSVRNNYLTQLPDLFTARSIYVMMSANFSNNRITSLENGEAWRGINASTLNLSNNRFETLPKQIIGSGAQIETLMFSGNGIRSIEEGALQGKNAAYLTTIDLSFNRLKEIPYYDFSAENLPYLYGIDLSSNAFEAFPYAPLSIDRLTVMSIRQQRDDEGNRTLREWPTGLHSCPRMSAFYIGSNDLRKVEDTISPYILLFEIKDNPNISIDLSAVCPYIEMGYYELIYDSWQDIRGCDALNLD